MVWGSCTASLLACSQLGGPLWRCHPLQLELSLLRPAPSTTECQVRHIQLTGLLNILRFCVCTFLVLVIFKSYKMIVIFKKNILNTKHSTTSNVDYSKF